MVLHLCLLRYFSSTNLVDCADNCYMSLYFLFLLFLSMFIQSRISKCCYLFFLFFPVFFSALYLFSILLLSTLLSIPFCFLPLFIHFIFRTLYCFLFKSVVLSFLFSYYSVQSASPLCSIPIQSVLFLVLVFIFRSLHLIYTSLLSLLLFVFFILLLFGKDL